MINLPIQSAGIPSGRLVYSPDADTVLGIKGGVVVQAFMYANGKVAGTIILVDIPNSGFGKEAVAAIRKSQFRPAKSTVSS